MSSKETKFSRTEEKRGTDFRLEIPDDVYQKIMWWVNKSSHEVSGFGNLHFDDKKKVFTVTDAILLKQTVAPTSTEIDPVALGKAMYETREQNNALKWHWHSHVNMPVFWSGDDRELIRSLAHQGWILATVFNKKCEMRTAFSQVVRVMGNEHELFVDDITTNVQRFIDSGLCAQWDKEYDEKVSAYVPKSYSYHSPGVYPDFPSRTALEESWNRLDPDKKKDWTAQQELTGRTLSESTETSELALSPPIRDIEFQVDVQFDSYGMAPHPKDGFVYNPVYDRDLRDFEDVMHAIDQMEINDLEWCLRNDNEFLEYHRAYLAQKAKVGNAREHS